LKHRALALLLVVAIVASAVAPMVALTSGPAAAAASGPSDMVALGDAQVSEDLPADADVPIRASDLEGNVWASEHADTLEVIVTTPDHADEYVDTSGSNILEGDDVALIVADSETHDGRDVAVGAQLLEDALGYQPEAAFGLHSSGEEWSSAISYDGGGAVFEVPKFSENTVSFSGGISLSGSNAVDGTSYSYELGSLDGVDNFAVDLTGRRKTKQDQRTATTASGSLDLDVGGTTSAENATMRLTGIDNGSTETRSGSLAPGGSDAITVGGNDKPTNATLTIEGKPYSETSKSETFGNSGGSISPGGDLSPTDGYVSISASKFTGTSYYPDNNDKTLSLVPSGGGTVTETISIPSGVTTSQFKFHELYSYYGTSFEFYIDGTKIYSGNANENFQDVSTSIGDYSGSVDVTLKNTGSNKLKYPDSDYSDRGRNQITIEGVNPSGESVSIGGTTYTSSQSFAVSDGYQSVNVDGGGGIADVEISWTERDGVKDPSVSVGSSTVSQTGTFSGTHTETVDLSTGSDTIDASYSGSGLSYNLSWEEHEYPSDPTIQLDGGATTLTHTGELAPGNTAEKSIALSPGSHSASISSDGPVEAEVVWTEVSETTNAGISVNGNERTIDGTIPEGQTESLPADEAWLEEGTNNVSVVTADAGSGPAPEVGLEYQHEAGATSIDETVEASTWKESYNVSHTFPSQQTGAEARLGYAPNVIDIRNLEMRTNGGSWQSVSESDYTLENSTLVVDLGDVVADTTVDIRATGGKIQTYDGAVDILKPTAEGDQLATEIEVTEVASDGMLGIDVSETAVEDRVHYSTGESFEGSAHAEVTASGDQILRAPDANAGSTMTIETLPVSVAPESGAMEVEVEQDGSEPRFRLRQGNTVGASNVEVGYYDTLSGERYVLWSETQDREVDSDRAESPVFFATDGSSETYSILQRDAPQSGGGGAAPAAAGGGLSLSLILPAVAISVGGLWWAGRRFGGARGVRGNSVLLVGASILAVVAAELVTPRSLTSDLIFALSDSLAGGAGAVILSVLLVVGLWQINERTSADVPWWVMGVGGFGAVVLSAEAIRPGSVLGALEGALSEVGAAVILLGIIVLGAVLWRRASTPDTEVTIDGGSDE